MLLLSACWGVCFILKRMCSLFFVDCSKDKLYYEYCGKVVRIYSDYLYRLLVAVIAYFNESTSDVDRFADRIVSLNVLALELLLV